MNLSKSESTILFINNKAIFENKNQPCEKCSGQTVLCACFCMYCFFDGQPCPGVSQKSEPKLGFYVPFNIQSHIAAGPQPCQLRDF